MKTGIKIFFALMSLTMVAISSCGNTEEYNLSDIEGLYEGTFTISSSLKSAKLNEGDADQGTAEVSIVGNMRIEVHCFGEDIDTTFMLDYYQDHDSVMVCLTGNDFENFYGHRLGQGHMEGGMMGDIGNGETEWMHHMNDEHEEGDEHFGGFNMHEKTFTYSFGMMDGSTAYYLKFHGVKQ